MVCYIEQGIFKSLDLGEIKKKIQKKVELCHWLGLLGGIKASLL
jgi:hypothetical protein